MSIINVILLISLINTSVKCYIEEPGPRVKATKGEVWPKPQKQSKSSNYFVLRPDLFSFELSGEVDCPEFISDAFSRYWNLIAKYGLLERRKRGKEVGWRFGKKSWLADEDYIGYLDTLDVELTELCSKDDLVPQFGINENYTLSITAPEAKLTAASVWGILRGLETFSQLIYLENDALVINTTIIDDYPRFPHRGLLIDTSRHFIPVYLLYETLDAMAYNKLNVFHWHIVDDQSFPYKSLKFPQLSSKGAYHPISRVYEQVDIRKVIEYASARGIRVIPEFDTPGHTRSWGVAYPELLTECYNKSGVKTGQYGPMDPTKNFTYEFLEDLFTEVVEVFPDSYFHIGGDEVEFDCWENNPDIKEFMDKNNITSYERLESYFIQKVVNILNKLDSRYLVWEEVFVNGVQIPNDTVVHVWRDWTAPLVTLADVTKSGKYGLYSACWYLDRLETGGDWQKYYECEPLDFPGTEESKKLVIGGEACMWAETVNEYNLISRVWPRASAAAEKLWSDISVNDTTEAAQRLEEHACRLNHRGIEAQPPNGPGVCL